MRQKVDFPSPCSSLTSSGAVLCACSPSERPAHCAASPSIHRWKACIHKGLSDTRAARSCSRSRPSHAGSRWKYCRKGWYSGTSAECTMRATSRSQQSMPCRCASRQTAFRSRSVTGRKFPFPSSGRQRNSVAPVSTLKRNPYRPARKLPRADSRLAAFRDAVSRTAGAASGTRRMAPVVSGRVLSCGAVEFPFSGKLVRRVSAVLSACRFSFHLQTAACAIFLKSIMLCVFGVFSFANIRNGKALVKSFTVTLLITR